MSMDKHPGTVWRWVVYWLAWVALGTAATGQAPVPWSAQQVGKAGAPGGLDAEGSTLVVRGAGADIWREADGFYFVHVPWTGDGEFVARVVEVEQTDPWAKAGLMVREDLGESSRHAMIAMTPAQGATFLRRSEPLGPTVDDSHQAMRLVPGNRKLGFQQRGSAGVEKAEGSLVSAGPPRWLKLVRRDDVFVAYDSADGRVWEWLGTERVPMSAAVQVGLAVSSHDAARTCLAVFDQISFDPAPAARGRGSAASTGTGTGTGLAGRYFNSRNLSGPSLARVDEQIDFDWGLAAPMDGIGQDRFSVRWEGEVEAPHGGPFTFQVVSDNRARLWLNGELVIDEWYEHTVSRSSAVVELEAGKRYLLRLDYFEHRGPASVRLMWSSPSIPLEVIPRSQLFPVVADRDQDGLPDLWEVAEGLDPEDAGDAAKTTPDEPRDARARYAGRFETTIPKKSSRRASPEAWVGADVGRVGLDGTSERVGERWTVRGAGADIWANSDGFHYVYQARRGDAEIVVRWMRQDLTDPWAKSGVMIRAGLSAEAPHAMLAATPRNGLVFMQRLAEAEITTVDPAGPVSGPLWLKLVRRGDVLSAYRASTPEAWEWIGSERVELPDEALFGLAVNSHDNSVLGEAVFEEVAVRAPSSPRPEAPPRGVAHDGRARGLVGTYLDTTTRASVTRLDPVIDFDWGDDGPVEGIGADLFTVRWEGWLEVPATDEYLLDVYTDDGARLWLDGTLVLDAWSDRAPGHTAVKSKLEAGSRYAIKLEFYERTGAAAAKLMWSTASTGRQPVPEGWLHPPEAPPLPSVGPGAAAPGRDPSLASEAGEKGDAAADGARSTGSRTAGLPGGVTGVTTVLELPATAAVDRLGAWDSMGSELYCENRRGALDFDLAVPENDLYRIEIEGGSHSPFDPDGNFYLVASLDGERLGRVLLDAGAARYGRVGLLTPFLASGVHRLRIYWDNALQSRTFRLKAVRLQALHGPDADRDGRKDWVVAKLSAENGFDGSGDSVSSWVSPACLEGRGRFVPASRLRLPDGELPLRPGAGPRWFANVTLSPSAPTPVVASFQNGGWTESRTVTWRRFDLLSARDIVIRRGDALLLAAGDDHATGSERSEITVSDGARYVGAAGDAFPHRFEQDGEFVVAGVRTGAGGRARTGEVRVRVISAEFAGGTAAWVGKARVLDCPALPEHAVVEGDPRMNLEDLGARPGVGRQLRLTIDEADTRHLVARTGPDGLILAQTAVEGFRLYTGSETDLTIQTTYADGSQMIELTVVSSPALAPVRLELTVIVGGVTFDDGSLRKSLSAEDLHPLGEASVRFLRPAGLATSVCHRLRAWQGESLLGSY